MSLSPIQIRAAQLLARGLSQEETGRRVGVSRRTVVRWLLKEEFKSLSFGLVNSSSSSSTKNEAEIEPTNSTSHASDESIFELSHLVPLALRTLENTLSNPDVRQADKLKAVSLIGEWAGLTTDFNVALASLRRYGLVLSESQHGEWILLDQREKQIFDE